MKLVLNVFIEQSCIQVEFKSWLYLKLYFIYRCEAKHLSYIYEYLFDMFLIFSDCLPSLNSMQVGTSELCCYKLISVEGGTNRKLMQEDADLNKVHILYRVKEKKKQ